MDAIQAQINEAEKLAEYAVHNGTAELPAPPPGKKEFDAEQSGKLVLDIPNYKRAVNHYARTGDQSQVQRFTITSATQSGVYIPKEVIEPVTVRRLPNAIRAVLANFGALPITRDLTESISIPVNDDTANNGQQQAEGATSGTAADPDPSGSMTLNPTLYTSKQQWLSNTTVGAVDFDLFSYMMPMLVRRLDKVQESDWISTIKSNATVGKTAAATNALTYADWLSFEHSLPAAYRTDAAFMLSDAAYQAVRGMVDDNKRPICDLDPTNEFQARVHGKPIIISDFFDGVTAGGVVGCFASAEALKVFDAGPKRVARYVLQPSRPDQTGFELFANGDFDFVRAGVRTLAMHA
jgi:HK97 family phage major capsid protein